jgi:MarR family transcriptional regulator, 2-MHQ and catechol-resistance regulon repressor
MSRKQERKRKRALEAYDRLQRAASRSALRIDEALHRHGLGASQYGVLAALSEHGPVHQQELASALARSKAQMTAIIDVLEQRALVRRERQAGDKRFVTVYLTEAGTELHARVSPARDTAIVELMSELSGDQRVRLARLCRRLLRTLEPDRAGDESGDHEPAATDIPAAPLGAG